MNDAAKLNGNLLLISGELDRIADPAFTMQMANALIQANKKFEFLELPNADHGQYGDYGLKRRAEFFMRQLSPGHPQ